MEEVNQTAVEVVVPEAEADHTRAMAEIRVIRAVVKIKVSLKF